MTRSHIALLAAASALTLASCAGSGSTSSAGPEQSAADERGRIAATAQKREESRDGYAEAPPPPPPPPSIAAPSPLGGVTANARQMATAPMPLPSPQPMPGDVDRENYDNKPINPVKLVSEEPVSTFSIDVDTAAYANVRRYLNQGVLPPKDAVRVEELVNYFDYDYPLPRANAAPFETTVNVVPAPWAEGRQLMHIGVQGYDIKHETRPPLNLTLLLDVSGSMNSPDKLPLAINALKLLINEMSERDHISIAVYAGAAGTILEPTSGAEKQKIIAALDKLSAGGSTAGGEGLRLAYSLAKQNFQKDGVNRVILMTDGDFNVGINDPARLQDFIERERESGVYLSVMGLGQGNYNDALMQKLAQNGNGVAAYIDTLNEARKIFTDDLSGSMFSIADDVKIQVEFNPAKVAEYRLIGYETRMLNREDFNNDKVDAGEIGSGSSVTAIYEITPVGSTARLIDASRYAPAPTPAGSVRSTEYGFVKLRYKPPGEDVSKLVERPVTDRDAVSTLAQAPESTRFAVSVAAYGELLRGAPYLDKSFGWDAIINLANNAKGKDEYGYRSEFVNLARLAKTAASQAALKPPGSGVGR